VGLAVGGRQRVGHKILLLTLAQGGGGTEVAFPGDAQWKDAAPAVVAAIGGQAAAAGRQVRRAEGDRRHLRSRTDVARAAA